MSGTTRPRLAPAGRRGPAVGLPRLLALGACAALVALAGPPAAGAQERPDPVFPQEEAELPPLDVSPRGAFIRALAIPGWGHAAIGAYGRGGFYFTAEAATAYSLLRARRRLGEVRERLSFQEGFLRERLALEGVTDPDEIQAGLDADPVLQELVRLEDSRADQQEDMVAFGIFLIFLSGADAYVSAHLSRFPDPIDVEVGPLPDGSVALEVRVPLPR